MGLAGAIVDLDGTVYRGRELVPGAAEGVAALREAGLDLLFFSNNPTRSGDRYVGRLRELGIDARPGEALSAGDVTADYLSAEHADDAITVVGSEGLREQLRAAGLRLTSDPDDTQVFVGSWSRSFDYDDMQLALDAVDEQTVFLGTDPDVTVPGPDGPVPGSGAVIGALAGAVGREPDRILGKPSATARRAALDRLGHPAEACLVVGDRPDTDLALGADAGMSTVLVASGITDADAVAEASVQPDHVIDGLGDVAAVL